MYAAITPITLEMRIHEISLTEKFCMPHQVCMRCPAMVIEPGAIYRKVDT